MLYGFTHSQLGTSLPSSIQNYLFLILALVDFSLFYKLLLKVQIKIAAQLSIHCFLSANFHTHSLSLTPSVTGASHPCSFILTCNTLFAKPLLCSPRESIITFVSPSKTYINYTTKFPIFASRFHLGPVRNGCFITYFTSTNTSPRLFSI